MAVGQHVRYLLGLIFTLYCIVFLKAKLLIFARVLTKKVLLKLAFAVKRAWFVVLACWSLFVFCSLQVDQLLLSSSIRGEAEPAKWLRVWRILGREAGAHALILKIFLSKKTLPKERKGLRKAKVLQN